jgi:hypothetical protein
MPVLIKRTVISALFLLPMTLVAEVQFKQIAQFNIPGASQGVAVDRDYFYAVDNRAIAKYRKDSGEFVNRWEDRAGDHFIHLDSAVAVDGKIYAAHTNWPQLPVNSSVEIWNAGTMKHIRTHTFDRPELGWLTWLDFHDGHWWGTFAHYDLAGPGGMPYGGGKANTLLARLDQDWNICKFWRFPAQLLDKFGAMSNSGGSWGPDGFLYLTSHDLAEVYQIKLPADGSVLEMAKMLPLNIRGQGIAWDRHQGNVLYGIIRATGAEKRQGITHKVVAFQYDLR